MKLETRVTYLRMVDRPPARAVPRPKGKVALLRAEQIPPSFFRYLYHEVGKPWQWVERKLLDDEALAEILDDPSTEIYVLYVDGVPAGFAELNFAELPIAHIRYFGLTPAFGKRGLGAFFLDQVLDLLWSRTPQEIQVDTCTLDHPKALPLYQRHGFTPYAQEDKVLEIPDGLAERAGI